MTVPSPSDIRYQETVQKIHQKNLELAYRRRRHLEEELLKEKAKNMTETNQSSTAELTAGAAFFTWLTGMIVVIILNFIFGWNVFWPIIGIGIGAAVAIAALITAVSMGIAAYRASRRTRINR